VWEDNSLWSWVVNIILAFVLIKFIVYPGLGLVLATTHPVVAVVSSSMEHNAVFSCIDDKGFTGNVRGCDDFRYTMCGNIYEGKTAFKFDGYWEECGSWYEGIGIGKTDFSGFSFNNGFNKGDIMVLSGASVDTINVGDVIVFKSRREDPIIHRVVKKDAEAITFQTKGDNNRDSIDSIGLDETNIREEMVIGKAVFRIPFLGYIKIWFVEILEFAGLI